MASAVGKMALRGLLKKVKASEPEALAPIYKRHGVSLGKSTDSLANQIAKDGTNTFHLPFAGGQSWKAIVRDVAEYLKVKVAKKDTVASMERKILAHVAMKSFEVMDYEDQEEFIEELSQEHGVKAAEAYVQQLQSGELLSGKNIALMGGALGLTLGQKVLEKLLQKALINVGAKVGGQRIAGAAVPGLNILLGAWTLYEIAGPAFRKTVPTVVEVALLRLKFEEGPETKQLVGKSESKRKKSKPTEERKGEGS